MSRKSLVPIVLPADPTAALEAATKQYVDARVGFTSAYWFAKFVATNLPSTSEVTIPMAAATFNQGFTVDGSGARANAAGIYQVSVSYTTSGASVTYWEPRVKQYRSGSPLISTGIVASAYPGWANGSFTMLMNMAANDTVIGTIQTDTTATTRAVDASRSFITITRIA